MTYYEIAVSVRPLGLAIIEQHVTTLNKSNDRLFITVRAITIIGITLISGTSIHLEHVLADGTPLTVIITTIIVLSTNSPSRSIIANSCLINICHSCAANTNVHIRRSVPVLDFPYSPIPIRNIAPLEVDSFVRPHLSDTEGEEHD